MNTNTPLVKFVKSLSEQFNAKPAEIRSFKYIPGQTSKRWVGLFANKLFFESPKRRKSLSYFLNALISEWNYYTLYNPFERISRLVLADMKHLQEFNKASGYSLFHRDKK